MSFHVVVLWRTAKKCTDIYNARAQLLLCSLNFLFRDVPIAVAVVVLLPITLLIVGIEIVGGGGGGGAAMDALCEILFTR